MSQIQQLLHERVRFGPIWEYIWPSGIGPRVAELALMLINPYPWSAPWKRCVSRSETPAASGPRAQMLSSRSRFRQRIASFSCWVRLSIARIQETGQSSAMS